MRGGILRWAVIALAVAAALLAGLRFWPHAPLRDLIGGSVAIYARNGELMRLTLASDQQYRLWTPLDRISPLLVESVQLYEDRAFRWHPGVNPLALARSMLTMAGGGRRAGGSTITMQLARRLYGIDSRSIGGKLAQIAVALWIEVRHSKHEILEAYLNSAPYGGNIEGAGTASLIYFGHDAAKLTMPEALTLAVIPQHPARRIASRGDAVTGNPDLQAARARLWAAWQGRHPEQARAQAPEALMHLPALDRGDLPFAAPHLTDMLLAQRMQEGVLDADGSIHTTIDLAMQRTLERVTASYLKTRSAVGMRNASALLLDASTMEVRAVVGSADYRSTALSGQVNGTLAKRSPGSTLKPFIYALALDQGLLHPRTMLRDAPTAFGPFTPENFDGQYVGPLAAQDALTRSRNVPAVAVAAKLSQPNLYQFLKLNQVSRLESEAHYGLALVLGGGEVTMEELARMYAVLANGGQGGPVVYTRRQASSVPNTAPQRLLSPEAAFITLDMLRQTPRPDTGNPAQPAIAWKTGTSWGFRDAWTAGVFGRHVLVVWVGEFDGSSNPAFIGIDAAAPLFLRMVDALRAQRLDPGDVMRAQPADLERVTVCAETGDLPDTLCPVRVSTWFIAGKSPIRTSTLHRIAWVDARDGHTVCGPDSPDAKEVVVEDWDSEMRRLFSQGGMPRRTATAVDCGEADVEQDALGPRISAPLRGVSYLINPGKLEPIFLRADAAAGVRTLYWFAGGALLGRTAPGETLAWNPPGAGEYALRVVDDRGQADARLLRVALRP